MNEYDKKLDVKKMNLYNFNDSFCYNDYAIMIYVSL